MANTNIHTYILHIYRHPLKKSYFDNFLAQIGPFLNFKAQKGTQMVKIWFFEFFEENIYFQTHWCRYNLFSKLFLKIYILISFRPLKSKFDHFFTLEGQNMDFRKKSRKHIISASMCLKIYVFSKKFGNPYFDHFWASKVKKLVKFGPKKNPL